MDSLQQQVLSLLSEDWKSRIEIARETGASEHEVQVALNELQDQIETSYGPVAGLKKARMYRLKSCSLSSSPPSSTLQFPLDESPTRPTRLPHSRWAGSLQGLLPGAPTDPGVHVKCTRFVTLWNRCPPHDWVVSR